MGFDGDDERKDYIIKLLKCMWNEKIQMHSDQQSIDALAAFLDNPQRLVMYAECKQKLSTDGTDTAGRIYFYKESTATSANLTNNDGEQGETKHNMVVFVKTAPTSLSPTNIRSIVLLTTILQTPLQSFYNTVHHVYSPMLLSNDRAAIQMSQKLKTTLVELDIGLNGSILQTMNNANAGNSTQTNESILFSISCIQDEMQYWENNSIEPPRRAKKFSLAFDLIHHRYKQLNLLAFEEMEELLDETINVLDDIWQAEVPKEQQYSQERMNHTLGLVCVAVNSYIIEKSASLQINVWRSKFHEVTEFLQQSISLYEKWSDGIQLLTETTWPVITEHSWIGGKSDHSFTLQNQIKRLEDILGIRTISEELISLLPKECAISMPISAASTMTTVDECFRPFANLNPLYYNPYSENKWDNAHTMFERYLEPIEEQVIQVLQQKLVSVRGKPTTAIRMLERYRHVILRPTVKRALTGERDALLAHLVTHIMQLESDLESSQKISHEENLHHVGKTLSPAVNEITLICMRQQRAVEIRKLALLVLGDLPSFPDFQATCDTFVQKGSNIIIESIRDWQDRTQQQLDDKESLDTMRLSGKLMKIEESNGELVVNYSEFLVALLRDVRQLTELSVIARSFSTLSKDMEWVPPRIRSVAEEAEKYYRYGVSLKQIANFYNSMETQIIEEQKPMLLNALLAFEEIVKRSGQSSSSSSYSKEITWQNLEECDEYVKRLEAAANRLDGENRKLKQLHEKVGESLLKVVEVDLLRYPAKWKDLWDELKGMVSNTLKKQDPNLMKKWYLYWDYQVYKVLESGYQLGLVMLNEFPPEIKELKTELLFGPVIYPSNGSPICSLGFKPPIEELRVTYYKAMKKFVARPSKFQGFSNPQIFASMSDINALNLVYVYDLCEKLFSRVERLLLDYSEWEILNFLVPSSSNLYESRAVAGLDSDNSSAGIVSADQIIEQVLVEPIDWEVNLKTIKTKRKECELLPESIKVDCVVVSLVSLKQRIDEKLSKFQDFLILSLRKTLLHQITDIQYYLDWSMEKLNSRPHSIDEIGRAQLDWKDIDSKRPEVLIQIESAEKKRELLLSVTTNSLGDFADLEAQITQIPTKWENFEIALEAFNDMLGEQRESLKSDLENQVVDCNVEIDKFKQRWTVCKPVEVNTWDTESLAKIYSDLGAWREKLDGLRDTSSILRNNCGVFGMEEPVFEGLNELEKDVLYTDSNWTSYKGFQEELSALAAQDWITFCMNMFTLPDCTQKWLDTAKNLNSKHENSADAPHVRHVVVEKISNFNNQIKRSMPTLKLCRGEPFKDDHWTQLFRKLGFPKSIDKSNLALSHFLNVLDHLETPSVLQFVKDLNARAQGEVTIRDALLELQAWTETAEFALHEHVTGKGDEMKIIKDWKDTILSLNDNQSLLSSLKESQFFKAFEGQAIQYEVKMTSLDKSLSQINLIQRKWLYLEPIFSKGALPSEQSRFRKVDDEFKDIMLTIANDTSLFSLADEMAFPQLPERLNMMVSHLERCQIALAEFLEEKRSKMPRFYFIGDDDLLEILGQSQNPSVIQNHLKKLFQGVGRVEFSEPKDGVVTIVAMVSSAGEQVTLASPVKITAAVEDWLEEFKTEMQHTLRILVTTCVNATEQNYLEYPSQVLCLAEQIRFSKNVEQAIHSGSLPKLKEELRSALQELTSIDVGSDVLLSLKIKALVLDLVHHIDICNQLIKAQCSTVTDWIWQKQLRFYITEFGNKNENDQQCLVKMNDATFEYTYEYQGNAPKLVHTPLTDKCYLTLTQGMHMGFGGNPYGPAGTGKTESVKALGGQLGRQVLVFNCDEGLDFQSMGRIFIGLVKCGAWGCFDEFNRLKEDQLSAISQQIQIIQDAIKNKLTPVSLLNRQVDVNFHSGIFVTLNPAGKGYGGRSRLPDNLKALFRPIAMGRPDNNLIAENILYSEGFSNAKEIASKVVSLYKLAGQLLSPQQHYDWGLRALKAVLNTAGKLLQNAKVQLKDQKLTPCEETEILIKATRINTLSKLTFVDASRFLALVGDVFPGIPSSDLSGGQLAEAIEQVMTAKPFYCQADQGQIRKMLQLKESLDQRMGCVIVGPSGSGKSTVWKILQQALVRCGQQVNTYVMNPKSMPRERLLGRMDLDTREWFDGVLTDAARKIVNEPETIKCWIICDGDVDPEWIEALNSVLDDNHLLTLANGERINFGSNVNFIFETHDLRYASPATISRMGMVFLSNQDMELTRLVNQWLATTISDTKQREQLREWMDEIIIKVMDEILKYEQVVETTIVGILRNGLSHVASVTTRLEFIVSLARGLSANLSSSSKSAFSKVLFQLANERPPDINNPLDYYCEGSTYISFASLRDSPPQSGDIVVENERMTEIVVPTIALQRSMKIIAPWIATMEPFILVGPEGCGKNMLIRHALKGLKHTIVTVLNCSSQTTSDHIIHKITQNCSLFSTPSGRVYRPKDCERLVIYLKDINLPKPDEYETSMLVSFLQQLITFKGFYDQNLEFLGIEKIQIVASMNAVTTIGRHRLSTRFTSIVRIASIDYPAADELTVVYSKLLERVFQKHAIAQWKDSSTCGKLARTVVEIYEIVKAKFTVDDQRHYIFTPRDITNWITSLQRYDLYGEEVIDLIIYEAIHIFRNRLVGNEAKGKFDSILYGVIKQQWGNRGITANSYFSCLQLASSHRVGSAQPDADGSNILTKSDSFPLRRITAQDLKNVINHGAILYEREEKELHMLLFDQILDHVASITRILSSAGGSLLMVGSSGVGRRSATTLISYMLGYVFYSPSFSRNYNAQDFRNELKNILMKASVGGIHYVLYLEDHHLDCPQVLELTNSLLSSGEIPGLFTSEEIEPLIAPLKDKMIESGGDYRTVYEYFISRVCKFVHVVVAMDSKHPLFILRCESNPALYTRCSILWMGDWTAESMKQIPKLLFEAKCDETLLSDKTTLGANTLAHSGIKCESRNTHQHGAQLLLDNLPKTISLIKVLFDTCKQFGASPREYMKFLECWLELFSQKYLHIQLEASHLMSGLVKLEEASSTVDELSRNAVVKKGELQKAQVAADKAMEEITLALEKASANRHEVEELKKQLAIAEKATNTRKHEIETELQEVMPILQSAKDAVGLIKSDNLNEIRSLKMPPEPIHDVLSAVLMLLGIQDTSWNSMKKFLGNRGVKEDILNYDAHRITPDIGKHVAKLVKTKASSFEHETIYRVSVAAAPLAAWVKANLKYSVVLNRIEPLEADLKEANLKLESSHQRLQQCASELEQIDKKVDEMKLQFRVKTGEAETLRVSLDKAEQTLEKAQGLLKQLSGEQLRWSDQVKVLNLRLVELPVRMLIAAAYTSFLGKCSEDERQRVVGSWEKELLDNSYADGTEGNGKFTFQYLNVMSTESERLTWKAMGLPADNLSVENALIVNNSISNRCPYIVDPANACTTWLSSHFGSSESSPISIITSQDQRFVNLVEQAIRFGKTLVVQDVDTLEPYLYPIVRKDSIRQGARFVIFMGDKFIDYNENFRMVLVSRNPTPTLPPDAMAIVNVVNFTVTKSGLEGQLLGVTIQHEQPALELEKSELVHQEEQCKVQLAQLEQKLVETLASSEGDILENASLIESLTRTKITSKTIEESLAKSSQKSEELNEQREIYRPFAHDGAKLFFLVKKLSIVNHMYRFSLAAFLSLFKDTLSKKVDSGSKKARIAQLTPILEVRVYMFVARALFKEHRPMFGLHLVHGMHPELFESNEYEFFCGKNSSRVEQGGSSNRHASLPDWAPTERKAAFERFTRTFPKLAELCKFESNDLWIRWSKTQDCEKSFHQKLDNSNSGLSLFQKLLVVQTLRPDRLQSAIILFICTALNITTVTPPSVDLKTIGLDEATNSIPILLMTSPGTDPSRELEEVAASVIGGNHYFAIAMGGGQHERAKSLLSSTAEKGEWLCLQNLHLVIGWLPVLEKDINALSSHEDFRLWLTTEPHDNFPTVMMESSLKITFESPPGIKKNLQRIYASWDMNFIDSGSTARAQLLFMLAYFHALLQERRTYIPQGWTKFYEFSFGDFRAGICVIEAACKSGGSIDWPTLHGLLENAIYGGRIDNPYDLRVLRCNIAQYFNCDILSGQKNILYNIKLPQNRSHTDYSDLINRLPDSDSPGIFGLPDNIERSMQRNVSNKVINQLQTLSTIENENEIFDREKWRSHLGPLLETWSRLTSSVNLDNTVATQATNVKSTNKNLHLLTPSNAFVTLESEFANSLIQIVNCSLMNLKKVIYGTGLLSPAIQVVATALLKGIVPIEWSTKWEGIENVQLWLRGLALRYQALSEWQDAANGGKLLQLGLNLSELFNPGTFLNALRQQSARHLKCSMDEMKLISCWDKNLSEHDRWSSIEWYEITELYLQGACFQNSVLVEPHSDAQELIKLPSCYIAYVQNDTTELYSSDAQIKVPLYLNTSRERLLVELAMPIIGDQSQWVLAGVALFLADA